MNVAFSSDAHLGHKLAATKRGFSSVERHDEAVISSYKDVCTKRTHLWLLGDVSFTVGGLERLRELPGKKILVRGNHDNLRVNYADYFDEIYGIVKYKNMWISHMPPHPQELYRCKAFLHGHLHKDSNSPELEFPFINVNWDYWHRAVDLDEIKGMIEKVRKM